MTLEQLRIFLKVAELEHMTNAAEELNLTQSAVSTAISSLEARHGVRLFDRIGRRIELTETGRSLTPVVRSLLDHASLVENFLADLDTVVRGKIKLVASQTIASYWLPRYVAAFHLDHPQVEIELTIDNTEGALSHILSGSAELGFAEGSVHEPNVKSWPIANDKLLIVSHEPVARADLNWIASKRWIMRERGSGTRSTFEEYLAGEGIAPNKLNVIQTLPSNEAIRTVVEAGAGVAVLPESVARPFIVSESIFKVPIDLPDRPYFAMHHKERHSTRLVKLFLEKINSGYK